MVKEVRRNLNSPRDLMERALSSPKGIRIFFRSEKEAISMRNRMNSVKTDERKRNNKMYELGDECYNTTPYDSLATIIKSGVLSNREEMNRLLELPAEYIWQGVWLYVVPQGESTRGFVIEDL